MSDDLIRRSDAIKAVWEQDNPTHDGMVFEVQSHIDRDIKLIPSADRPQGKWKVKSFHECFCNNCGFSFDIMKCEFLENMKYCPNCGVPKGADDDRI